MVYMGSYQAILKQQVISNIVINFLIAYFLSTATLAAITTIPLQAPQDNIMAPNMAGDLMVGSFIMGVILTTVLTLIMRLQLRNKTIAVPEHVALSIIAKLPNNLVARGTVVGFLSMCLVGVPAAILLAVFGIMQASTQDYIFYHGIYAAVLGGGMSYVVAKRVMLEGS